MEQTLFHAFWTIVTTRGGKINNFSQGLKMTIQNTVNLPSYFTGIMDYSDNPREQSDFREIMYLLVCIKEIR